MYKVEITLEAIPEIFNNREIVRKVPELFDRDANRNRLVASANYFNEQEERQSFTVFCEDIKGIKKLADKYFIKVMEYILEKCQDDTDEDDIFHYNLDISKNASAAIYILKAIIISESIERRGFYFSYEDGGSVLFDMNVIPIEKFMLSDKNGIFMLTKKENNALVMHIEEYMDCQEILDSITKEN